MSKNNIKMNNKKSSCGCHTSKNHGNGCGCGDDSCKCSDDCDCDDSECSCGCHSQSKIPLIGDDAPSFEANTTQGKINFPKDYKGKWVILFSHPADFTPVCTTEFVMFASMIKEFKALNTELIGLSVDSIHSHLAWLKAINEKIEFNGIKNADITFPLIDDIKMEVAKKYGMIQPNASTTAAVRAVFFIDPKGKIRCLVYYPLSLGRNFNEIKRILLGLQKSDKDKVSLPANWQPGDDVIVSAPSNYYDAINREKLMRTNKDITVKDWFLCLRKDKKTGKK